MFGLLLHAGYFSTLAGYFFLGLFNLSIKNVFYLQEDDLKWVEENIPSSAADA